MTCPPGSMKFSDQPLIAELPVLVIVRFDVRPVFHDWIVSVTWQDDEPLVGVVVGGVPTVVVVGGGGLPLRPKNWIASAAMPDSGRLWPTPAMLYASTCEPYRVRVQPDCGVSVDVGV